ncbi:hypothetical protein Ddye_028979 [Dipteronia dyeriana]|uniref:Uncharacterized protein n=1 Tax=Dipteronia dyeriana TaxID=168575 RepID=A0AAD9WL29_9ROSI|nr:hypothetical protein Ddye_028979 [Dipteronia dyeriana]
MFNCFLLLGEDGDILKRAEEEYEYMIRLSDGGTVNLLSRSYGAYINELGLQKCMFGSAFGFALVDEANRGEKTYRCASHEMRIFGLKGSGASSAV